FSASSIILCSLVSTSRGVPWTMRVATKVAGPVSAATSPRSSGSTTRMRSSTSAWRSAVALRPTSAPSATSSSSLRVSGTSVLAACSSAARCNTRSSAARCRTGGVGSATSDALKREGDLALHLVDHEVGHRECLGQRGEGAALRRRLAHLREVVARVARAGAGQAVLDEQGAAADEAVGAERIAESLALLRWREVVVHGDAGHRAGRLVRE